MTERTVRAIAVDRNIDDTRPVFGEFRWSEAELFDHPRPVALRKNISVFDESFKLNRLFKDRKVEETTPLTVARIHHVFGDLGKAPGRHHQHFSTMLCQGASRNRPGQNTC